MVEEQNESEALPETAGAEPEVEGVASDLAVIKIQALARGRQTRSIMKGEDLQSAKDTLSARHDKKMESLSLSAVRPAGFAQNPKDSKALEVCSITLRRALISGGISLCCMAHCE